MQLECVKSDKELERVRGRILEAANGVIVPVGGAGDFPVKGQTCRIHFNQPNRFVEAACEGDEPEARAPKTMQGGLIVSMGRPMERLISHHADCVEFFQSVVRATGITQESFLLTGGSPGSEEFRDIVTRLCTKNAILGFTGRLFCLRMHGSGACKVTPAAVPVDGEACPACIFSTEDMRTTEWAYMRLADRALFEMGREVDHVIKLGTLTDGHSVPTPEWLTRTTRTIVRLAREATGWTHDDDVKTKLQKFAEWKHAGVAAFMKRGFSPPLRTMTTASPSGARHVPRSSTPSPDWLSRAMQSMSPTRKGVPTFTGKGFSPPPRRRARSDPKASDEEPQDRRVKARRLINF